ncbi:conserved Plasmodium protein, unknown function [Plasmodium malariae]|uniref:Uncharacterized protein n=1 Tax=Plasmodium malariae TaxID=5858 RepID=A0A1A8WUQ1_PLAMA|nr:conserved Plasmodium protein, unknown function [Plasmodium malariae]
MKSRKNNKTDKANKASRANTCKVKYSFLYNDKILKLAENIVILANSLSLYKKKYNNYVMREELSTKKRNCKNGKCIESNNNNNRDQLNRNKYIRGLSINSSFFPIFNFYECFVRDLIDLCNNYTDIYVEFLYILIINSNLFNNFIYICTFTSGDKNDLFLYLMYKNFLILIEYYYYFNNSFYFNELYIKLKGIYDNRENLVDNCKARKKKYVLLGKSVNFLSNQIDPEQCGTFREKKRRKVRGVQNVRHV